ncbi:MAG: prepilin-type N-terminal cleavage/methylation domain-containing protein [Magnetococcales bacterium]|nr:prepilin-type N-terminal cleavage/methylation domain-containing protein [Magnetococcales bacterium]
MKGKFGIRKEGGFSMVELAIVLAIIALILGAVAVGKDLQRNAEYRKITNKFVGQWAQAYNQYYERTGVVIGDSLANPTGKVGGGDSSVISGSAMVTEFLNKGVNLPEGNGQTEVGNARFYRYLDAAGIPRLVTISFTHTANGSTASGGVIGNVMIIDNVTPQLGAIMDSVVDGIVDADQGYFRGNSANSWGSDTSADSAAKEETSEVAQTAFWKMNQ